MLERVSGNAEGVAQSESGGGGYAIFAVRNECMLLSRDVFLISAVARMQVAGA